MVASLPQEAATYALAQGLNISPEAVYERQKKADQAVVDVEPAALQALQPVNCEEVDVGGDAGTSTQDAVQAPTVADAELVAQAAVGSERMNLVSAGVEVCLVHLSFLRNSSALWGGP